MQAVRADESSHLLFLPEGNPEEDGSAVLSEGFRVLWPISTTLRTNDPTLAPESEQNPGY